jgi:hypothetical protein
MAAILSEVWLEGEVQEVVDTAGARPGSPECAPAAFPFIASSVEEPDSALPENALIVLSQKVAGEGI